VVVVVSRNGGPPITEDDIRQHFRDNAPPYMMPKNILFREELPKTATGKVDRPTLKAEFVGGQQPRT
jgi:acyl-coenzyme A synthetase/AMP-(fatty) acid ligase